MTTIRQDAVRAIPKDVEQTRTVPFVISDASRDRHNTVLSASGWELDAYRRNNIVGYMHNVYGGSLLTSPDPDSIIGKGRVYTEGGLLIGDTTFEPAEVNQTAEKIFRKVLFGSLGSCSVGFNELEKGKYGIGEEAQFGTRETYYVGKRELIEYSIVNIPSNRNTQKRSMRDEPEGTVAYVYRKLGDKYSLSQIRSLSVIEALTLLEGRDLDIIKKDPEAVRLLLEENKRLKSRIDTLERNVSYFKSRYVLPK